MSFLPKSYEAPVSSANFDYLKLKQGENKIRILSDASVGYIYWNTEGKPVRTPEFPTDISDARIDPNSGATDKPKHAWAVAVYSYAENKVCLWEITQVSIREQIAGLVNDEDWGHPASYDLKINRTGTGLDTRYNVVPGAKKEVTKEIIALYADAGLDISGHFEQETRTPAIPF